MRKVWVLDIREMDIQERSWGHLGAEEWGLCQKARRGALRASHMKKWEGRKGRNKQGSEGVSREVEEKQESVGSRHQMKKQHQGGERWTKSNATDGSSEMRA